MFLLLSSGYLILLKRICIRCCVWSNRNNYTTIQCCLSLLKLPWPSEKWRDTVVHLIIQNLSHYYLEMCGTVGMGHLPSILARLFLSIFTLTALTSMHFDLSILQGCFCKCKMGFKVEINGWSKTAHILRHAFALKYLNCSMKKRCGPIIGH